MVNRGILSVLDETYAWVREHREFTKPRQLPLEVRRELAALAPLLLLIEQRVDAPWIPFAWMCDASDWGAGICVTAAEPAELRKEARWATKGHWLTLGVTSTFADYWRRSAPQVEDSRLSVPLVVPPGLSLRYYTFVHLFSGARREQDLEWYLTRLGGLVGIRVLVLNYDAAYGGAYDL